MNTNGNVPGAVYGLWHQSSRMFSGYGIAIDSSSPAHLVGLLMVDRPFPVDPTWLGLVDIMFGGFSLHQMTIDGARGLACQMYIAEDSQGFIKPLLQDHAPAFRAALQPLVDTLPVVQLELHWDVRRKLWLSQFRLDPTGANPGQPRFHLGEIVATTGAATTLIEHDVSPRDLLRRHVSGDWGELEAEDAQENEFSVVHGYRILSRYVLESKAVLWIITEHDRSVTTLLLPSEY